MPEAINRIPPSSIEAEQSVLGAMLLSENCVLEAAAKLKEEDFQVVLNQYLGYLISNGRI